MKRNRKKKSFIKLVSRILVIALILSLILDNTLIQISKYTIQSNKIPSAFDGFTIVQISDLHSSVFGKDNKQLLRKIEKQNPDIVVMTGDMINTTDENYAIFFNLADEISKKHEVYYIVGNHEQNLPEENKLAFINHLFEIGVTVLDNEFVSIKKGNESINLYGLWFNLRYYKDIKNELTKDIYFYNENMIKILGENDKTKYNILLTHNPLYFETYANWGADLTLSGHIHGGMIRIPFKGGLFSPERDFYPKYDAGEYHIDENVLIVNRGLGNGEIGIRVFNRPDISVITLKSQKRE